MNITSDCNIYSTACIELDVHIELEVHVHTVHDSTACTCIELEVHVHTACQGTCT